MKGKIVKSIELGAAEYERLRRAFAVKPAAIRAVRELLIELVEELGARELDEFELLAKRFGYADVSAMSADEKEVSIDWITRVVVLREAIR